MVGARAKGAAFMTVLQSSRDAYSSHVQQRLRYIHRFAPVRNSLWSSPSEGNVRHMLWFSLLEASGWQQLHRRCKARCKHCRVSLCFRCAATLAPLNPARDCHQNALEKRMASCLHRSRDRAPQTSKISLHANPGRSPHGKSAQNILWQSYHYGRICNFQPLDSSLLRVLLG